MRGKNHHVPTVDEDFWLFNQGRYQRWGIFYGNGSPRMTRVISVELFDGLSQEPNGESGTDAIWHWDIIQRFGQFPHRNRILGQTTTLEEAAFLKQLVSSF